MKRFSAFELVHAEPSIIISSFNQQGANLGDFVYFGGYGLQGPIKIWNITYQGDEKINPEYTQMTYPDYITWKF